jgi:hypothetical protein
MPPGCVDAPVAIKSQPQYVVIKGNYKLILGDGGQPNTWYHDGLPYNGTEPTPEGGCLTPCSVPGNASGCPAMAVVQLYDVFADEAERHNLAPASPDIVAQLMAVVHKYNSSIYVDALLNRVPFQTKCPFNDANGVLTPCDNPNRRVKVK